MLLKLGRIRRMKCPPGGFARLYRVDAPRTGIEERYSRLRLQPCKISDAFKSKSPVVPHSNVIIKRLHSSEGSLGKVEFESVCAETLESLTEYFEELIETVPEFKNADVTYSDGVLTVHLGKSYGTYVINRQSPNLQIWLSSPMSGPKRYDFIDGGWVYKHDQTTLHSLLDKEIAGFAHKEVQFSKKCIYGKCKNS